MTGDVADNIPKVECEEDFERNTKLISLLNLPEDIEKQIVEKIKDLPKKELMIEEISFPSVRKQYYQVYEKKEK